MIKILPVVGALYELMLDMFVKFAETHSINIYGSKTDLQELLRLYDDTRKYHGLMVIVELSDENIQKAEEQFHYILETKIK